MLALRCSSVCSHAEFQSSRRMKPQILFFGIPKFSGASKDDDDDLTGAKKTDFFKADNFLTPGKSLKDVSQIFVTEKSNGENAKVGIVLIEGKVYLWSGSKQTVTITDPVVDPKLCGLTEEEHSDYPGNTIAQLWWNYWNSLSQRPQKPILRENSLVVISLQ